MNCSVSLKDRPYLRIKKNPMDIKLTTRYLADYEYETENESGNRLNFDMYPAEQKKYFSPMQMLLAATGAWAAVDIVQILKKKRKTVWDLEIKSSGTRREEEIPKKFTHINLHFILFSPDTTVEEFEKVVRLGVDKYCSVSASIDPAIEVKHTAEVRNENPKEEK